LYLRIQTGAIAERNRQGHLLKNMLRKLACYVEYVSGEDMEAFISSGYRPAPNARTKLRRYRNPSGESSTESEAANYN
jgi:hypothetical protein